jgi:hypothetical protein
MTLNVGIECDVLIAVGSWILGGWREIKPGNIPLPWSFGNKSN